jgi:CRP/FNR family transcriptional regulator, cyclic AMP receptor protein
MMNIIPDECSSCTTGKCFVQKCSNGWISNVASGKNTRVYRQGEAIFLENTPIFGLYFIKKGQVKIISTGLKGKTQIVRLAGDGHILGHMGKMKELYTIAAFALCDTEICFVQNELISDVFMNNPEFAYSLMMFYSRELRKSEIRSKYHATMNCSEKIIASLLYIRDVFGFQEDGTLNSKLSTKEIGQLAAVTPEQASRELAPLRKKNLVAFNGKKILLREPEKMKDIISSHGLVF